MNGTTYEGYAELLGGVKHAGMLLYLVNPYETTFERHEDVPDYQLQVRASRRRPGFLNFPRDELESRRGGCRVASRVFFFFCCESRLFRKGEDL